MKNTLSISLPACRKYRRLLLVLLFGVLGFLPGVTYAQITGASTVCIGATTTLSDATAGGTWTSSSTAATIGSLSGVVTGVSPGVSTITYTYGTGSATLTITVNPLPVAYPFSGSGTGSYCSGGTGLHIILSGSSGSANYQLFDGTTAIGSPLTGSGSTLDFGLQTMAGAYTVVATNPVTACSDTMTGHDTIVVNPTPSAITGQTALCPATTSTLSSMPGTGTWTSSNPAVGTIGASSGVVVPVSSGTTTISYTMPGTGCFTTALVTVTTSVCPLATIPPVCTSAPATITDCVMGGIWTSSATTIASIGSSTGIITGNATGSAIITYSLGTTGCTVTASVSVITGPAAIAGATATCIGSTITLLDGTPSGTWASSAPATATVSGTGIVTGMATGTAIISYTEGGCSATSVVTINAAPDAIGGPSSVCISSTIAETETITGGSWSISPTYLATIGTATGIVTGIGAGTATVTYTLGGCTTTKTITVNASAPITGTSGLCTGASATLSDVVTGGTWSSSMPAYVTVVAGSGSITGVAAGTSVISYVTTAGCTVAKTITVSTYPGPITAPFTFCNGTCIYPSVPTAGGAWSSSFPAIATIDASSGYLCGLAPGAVTVTYTLGGCSATATITVNPAPAAMVGPSGLCVGQSTTYTDVFSGGAWSSGSPSIVSMGTGTGILTGITSGTVIISYTLGGCSAILPVIVYPFTPMSGSSSVCIGQTIVMSDATYGGGWSSSAPGVATVSSGGLVTGISAGTATISYALPGGCIATAVVSVNALPLAIAGPHSVCAGASIALSDLSPGGVWSSSNELVATISGTGSVSGIMAGTDTISYAYAGGGCATTFIVTVNPLPASISGLSLVCVGGTIILADATFGGSWQSSLPSLASVGSGTGVITGIATGTPVISYSLPTGCFAITSISVIAAPAAIGGATSLCVGTTTALTDATTGGAWSSNNTPVATVDPITGMVSGVAAGTAVITYSTGTGCDVTMVITVNPLPYSISGPTVVCQGVTMTMTDIVPGGIWSSSNTSVATIAPTMGSVTGITGGITTISYTLGTGCSSSINLLVNPLPSAISGIPMVCVGLITSLSDITSGGTWSSSNTSIAPVGPSGVVTGLATGIATITYTAATGCYTTYPVAVNTPPVVISGTSTICDGTSTIYTDGVPGGEWLSSNPAVAYAGSTSGVVTGVSAGMATITYMTGAGCQLTKSITVDPAPSFISGPGNMCTGTTITLTDATVGGTWSSSAPTLASIGSGTGILTGLSAGTVSIGYTFGCTVTMLVTVKPAPSVISGPVNNCIGSTITLADSITGGVWTSSITSIATIDSSTGVLTGITAGTVTINYTLAGGCFSSFIVHVYAPPSVFAITGGGNYCSGDSGTHIGISGSEAGVNYLLYRDGTTPTGTFAGTGSALDFGWQTIAGSYTVVGTNTISGCSNNMPGSVSVGIITSVIPSVGITVSPGDTVCSGTTVTYTQTSVNGGTTPAYEWYINGINVAGSNSYTYIPVAGDVVTVKLTSSAVCARPDSVFYSDTVTVHASAPPSITISASPGDTVCKGSIISITAATVYGGTTPVYSWKKNGVLVSSATLYSFIPVNNDIVYCVLQSNYPCRTANTDTSNQLTIVVDTPVAPVVTITASPGTIVNPGMPDTLTATATNGGFSPLWQWFENGVPITGATNSTYIIDTFSAVQLDSFTCQVTSSGPCVLTGSQSVAIIVAPVSVHQLSMQGSDIRVSPNPAKGTFTITGSIATISGDEVVNIELTNLLGQVVYRSKATASNGQLNERINTGGLLANGIYVLTVRSSAAYRVFHLMIEQ